MGSNNKMWSKTPALRTENCNKTKRRNNLIIWTKTFKILTKNILSLQRAERGFHGLLFSSIGERSLQRIAPNKTHMAYDLMDLLLLLLLLLALYYQNIILRIVNILSENPVDA